MLVREAAPIGLSEPTGRRQRIYGGHKYVESSKTLTDKRGRVHPLCKECGKANNAPAHRATAIAGPPPPTLVRKGGPSAASQQPPVDHHDFVDSYERIPDKIGKLHRKCATCGQPKISPRHRPAQRTKPATVPPEPIAEPEAKPKPAPLPTTREEWLLALALDALLELPIEAVEWRVRLRAHELRRAMDHIPETGQEKWRHSYIEPEETREREERELAPIMAEIELPTPKRRIERVEKSAHARARSMTKSIKDPRARELAVRAVADGWTLRRTGNGHFRLERGMAALTFGGTPSDWRAWLNTRATAQRKGIDVEGL